MHTFTHAAHLLAVWAEQGGLELALEHAHNHRLVPLQVLVPRLVGNVVVLALLALHIHVDVGLGLDQVEVLVESFQEEGQQLLRVVLDVAHKLRGVAPDLGLQGRQGKLQVLS